MQRKLNEVRQKMALDKELHKSDVSTLKTLHTNGQKVIEAFESSADPQTPGEGLEYTSGNIGLGGEPCGERTQNWINGCVVDDPEGSAADPVQSEFLLNSGSIPPGSPSIHQVSSLQQAIDRVAQRRKSTPPKTLSSSLADLEIKGQPVPAVRQALNLKPSTAVSNATFTKSKAAATNPIGQQVTPPPPPPAPGVDAEANRKLKEEAEKKEAV